MNRKIILPASALCIALAAGCTNPDGTDSNAGTGALTGVAVGAALGNLIGGNTTATVIGGAVGTIAGTAIGASLDAQAAELQQEIGGSGATIVNDGNRLVVSLPQAITFDVDSSEVYPGIRGELIAVGQSAQRYPDTTLQVVGHTDSTGSLQHNQALSESRARAVADILIAADVSPSRVLSYGLGPNQPVADNGTEAGRSANRRVEIVITPKG